MPSNTTGYWKEDRPGQNLKQSAEYLQKGKNTSTNLVILMTSSERGEKEVLLLQKKNMKSSKLPQMGNLTVTIKSFQILRSNYASTTNNSTRVFPSYILIHVTIKSTSPTNLLLNHLQHHFLSTFPSNHTYLTTPIPNTRKMFYLPTSSLNFL